MIACTGIKVRRWNCRRSHPIWFTTIDTWLTGGGVGWCLKSRTWVTSEYIYLEWSSSWFISEFDSLRIRDIYTNSPTITLAIEVCLIQVKGLPRLWITSPHSRSKSLMVDDQVVLTVAWLEELEGRRKRSLYENRAAQSSSYRRHVYLHCSLRSQWSVWGLFEVRVGYGDPVGLQHHQLTLCISWTEPASVTGCWWGEEKNRWECDSIYIDCLPRFSLSQSMYL